jgi:pimeloyl-ACP methyl ester carboxylesterase
MAAAILHDGSSIEVEVHGDGPNLLLPVNPKPAEEGPAAQAMREWGADPALGHSLVAGLRDGFRVVAFDYEGHVMANPKPLTSDTVTRDLLAVADAVDADTFGYYGYSWLAMVGMQLAIRTRRCAALVMGGYPPLGGPYAEMLSVTRAGHRLAVEAVDAPPAAPVAAGDWENATVSLAPEQVQQFVALYEELQDFDDLAAQDGLSCPRLCFAGSADAIEYGPKWGAVRVDIAGPTVGRRAEIEKLGWDVQVLDGLDHTQAMQANQVIPIIRPWLAAKLRKP